MHVDLPSDSEIRALLEHVGTTCVSIYMPATPQSDDADAERIAFKNLVADVSARLSADGSDKRERAAIRDALTDLGDDPYFWRHQANSLAVLATADELHVYRLANRVDPHVVVADRFFLMPLLRATTYPSAGFVLALAQGSVRLLEFGGDHGPHEVDVADLPTDIDSFVETLPGGDGSEQWGVLSPDGQRVLLRTYARQVDRAVRAAVRGHELPVVLAAAEPLASIFPAVSTLSTLARESIPGSPERVPDHELVAAARTVLDGIYAAQTAELAERYARRAGQGRTATDLADIARAATYGAVETLVVDGHHRVPGTVGADGGLTFGDGPDVTDVVDEIARRVLRSGGRVVVLRAGEVPGDGEIAALLRYALGRIDG